MYLSVWCVTFPKQRRHAQTEVLFVFSILSFVFVFFFKLIFLFCFSKVTNIKDMLAFYHLSHKLNCVLFD